MRQNWGALPAPNPAGPFLQGRSRTAEQLRTELPDALLHLDELLCLEEAKDSRVVENLPARVDESDGRQPFHPEPAVERIDVLVFVGAVDLDADKARRLGDHLRGDIDVAIELF